MWMCDYQIHLALMEKLSLLSFLNVFYYVFVFNRKRLISSSVSLSKKTKRPSKMRTVRKSQKSQRKQTHCPRRRSQEVCVCLFFWQTRCFLTGQMDATECVWWISLRLSLRSQSGLHRLHGSKPPWVSSQHAEEQPPVCENPPAVTRVPSCRFIELLPKILFKTCTYVTLNMHYIFFLMFFFYQFMHNICCILIYYVY